MSPLSTNGARLTVRLTGLALAALAGCSAASLFMSAAHAQEASPGAAQRADDSGPTAGPDVIAVLGSERITLAELIGQDQKEFDKQQSDYAVKLRQLQIQHEEAHHQLLQQQLEKLLDQRALQMEAQARGITGDAVLADIKVPAVTEDEARAFYDARKQFTTKTFEQVEAEINQFLASQHDTDAKRKFYDMLRAKHDIVSLLAPFRIPVAATGPTRGKAGAPVTIVEFADFQCPYCRAAENTLNTVLQDHPNDVRLVYRYLPLESIHPNAAVAAAAGVCADKQGKFWAMHDAMFANQGALGETALKDTAGKLHLDVAAFSACLSDPRTVDLINSDTRAADELDITGTPYFFINGRPVNGNVPLQQFETIVQDELKHPSAALVNPPLRGDRS